MDDTSLLDLADSVISVDTGQLDNLQPGQLPPDFVPTAADTGTIIPPEMATLYASIVAQINYSYRI